MGQNHDNDNEAGQARGHTEPPSEAALRLRALDSLLAERGVATDGGSAPATAAELAAIGLPGGAEPSLAEPWQAEAFALAMTLHRHGRFGWDEWAECLGRQAALYPAKPGESASEAYYRHWLIALEIMAARKGLIEGPDLDERAEAWRRAYLATPPGQPVELPSRP